MKIVSIHIITIIYNFLSFHNTPCTSFTTSISKHRQARQTNNMQQHPTTKNINTLFMSVPTPIDTLTSGLASIVRFPFGTTILPPESIKKEAVKSIKILKLYDVENNAQCRLVRECISELDCNVKEVIPCGTSNKGSEKEVIVPRIILEDEDGKEIDMAGSEAILTFFSKYKIDDTSSSEEVDLSKKLVAPEWTTYISSIFRYGRGQSVIPAAITTTKSSSYQPVILYNYENNQFCRLVREVLTELNLPYELRNAAKGSTTRDELAEMSTDGSTQCPFLIDPNTDTKMNESSDIILYLYKQYATWTPPNEILEFVSTKIIVPLFAPIFQKIALPDAEKGEYNVGDIRSQIEEDISSAPVVVYTYTLSPFCSECTTLLTRLDIPFKEISLGSEWLPGLNSNPEKRAVLGTNFGQTSLPHVFVNGKSIGGLFSGNPGVVPSLEDGTFIDMVTQAEQNF